MSDRMNNQWLLARRPEVDVKPSDFEWKQSPLPSVEEGQVLLRTIYISLDPANRVWMNDAASYMEPIRTGDVMRGIALARVEESRHPSFQAGEIVQSLTGWQQYAVVDGKMVTKLPPVGLPLTAYFGLLGHIGFTSYFGLIDIGQPKEGETLVVSAAAGAVGSIAGQIGKILGLRVVGIAGSDEKCQWIQKDLGFDAAINYRTEKVSAALKQHCPKGIDIDFENVGGDILDAILLRCNNHARLILCGMISQYNGPTGPGLRNISLAVTRRLKLQGFIVTDYMPRAREAAEKLISWHKEGKLKYRVDIVKGLENAPEALTRLFRGANQGKLLVEVSPAEE